VVVAQFSPVRIVGVRWMNPSPDGLYLVAVIVIGGIGSLIHALTSLASFAGNRTFRSSWTLWYIVRLPIGASIAVLLYFVVRGGLLSVGTSAGAISPYGVGALAGLSGMFSKQATDKLEEVFGTLFRTQKGGDAERRDKVDETVLSIDELVPATLSVGAAELKVRMVGTGFVAGMTVTVDGQRRSVEVVSPTEADLTLLASDVDGPRILEIVAATDAPSEELATVQLRIEAPDD
jgi:hypothetical protein